MYRRTSELSNEDSRLKRGMDIHHVAGTLTGVGVRDAIR